MSDVLTRIEDRGLQRGLQRGRSEGIIQLGKSLGWNDDQIIEKLMELCKISVETAKNLLK